MQHNLKIIFQNTNKQGEDYPRQLLWFMLHIINSFMGIMLFLTHKTCSMDQTANTTNHYIYDRFLI